MKRILSTLFCIAIVCILTSTAATAATTVQAVVTTAIGPIPGSNPDGSIPLISAGNGLSIATDPDTGSVLAGPPKLLDFTIVKPMDKSTPLLYQAAVAAVSLPSVVIDFKDNSTTYFRVTLTNCIITRVQNSNRDASQTPTEAVSLNYQSITWDHIPSGETASWTRP